MATSLILRGSFQPCWRIFVNWSQTKVEKPEEGSVKPLHYSGGCHGFFSGPFGGCEPNRSSTQHRSASSATSIWSVSNDVFQLMCAWSAVRLVFDGPIIRRSKKEEETNLYKDQVHSVYNLHCIYSCKILWYLSSPSLQGNWLSRLYTHYGLWTGWLKVIKDSYGSLWAIKLRC